MVTIAIVFCLSDEIFTTSCFPKVSPHPKYVHITQWPSARHGLLHPRLTVPFLQRRIYQGPPRCRCFLPLARRPPRRRRLVRTHHHYPVAAQEVCQPGPRLLRCLWAFLALHYVQYCVGKYCTMQMLSTPPYSLPGFRVFVGLWGAEPQVQRTGVAEMSLPQLNKATAAGPWVKVN
ncbi:hypothetical protein N657DRAFT_391711 [Parathielavia appendiculata]|uniref:Uncharacterized protein n=1 Tax=Parathielavia appendiculata TaxID=2587402 RepID=A0AAN6U111_9PEZI|nr:hypothetical protein N657DRAFT_391711 [Parathielavia appendiculata]